MPLITLLCVYAMPGHQPSSPEYQVKAMIDFTNALGKMLAMADSRRDNELNNNSGDKLVHTTGHYIVNMDLDVCFADKFSAQYYRNPSNYLTLYDQFDSAIKKTYGPNWKVIKNKLVPGPQLKFKRDDIKHQHQLVIKYTEPETPIVFSGFAAELD